MEGLPKLAVIVLLVIITVGFVLLIVDPERPTEIVITPGSGQAESRFGIFGAVRTPGYYSAGSPVRIEEAVEMAGGLVENADAENAHLAKWIDDGETVIIPTLGEIRPTLTPLAEERVLIDLNSADRAELMSLPGIGEKRAADIIALREKKGAFTAKEDLLEISGNSERLLESIYDLIIIR